MEIKNVQYKHQKLVPVSQKSINVEETKSSLKQTTELAEKDYKDSISESDFGSISEGPKSILIQRVPHFECPSHRQLVPRSESEQILLECITSNNYEQCKELLATSSKPDLIIRWENINTLLHLAAERGFVKIY